MKDYLQCCQAINKWGRCRNPLATVNHVMPHVYPRCSEHVIGLNTDLPYDYTLSFFSPTVHLSYIDLEIAFSLLATSLASEPSCHTLR